MRQHTLRLGVGFGLLAAAWPVAARAESMDAIGISQGGTMAARGSDVNSPFFNPAVLSEARGNIYLGPQFGLQLGNDTLGVVDVLSATQGNSSNPQLKAFQTYLSDIGRYGEAVKEANAKDALPQAPPAAPALPFGSSVNGFLRADSGLYGLRFSVAGDIQVGARGWARVVLPELTLSAPEIYEAAQQSLAVDRKLALSLRDLGQQIREDALDIGKLRGNIDQIRSQLDEGLQPLVQKDGAKVTIAANLGGYLTNAISFQVPAARLGLRQVGPIPLDKATLGATLKIHTGSAAIPALDSAFGMLGGNLPLGVVDNGGPTNLPVAVPMRVELVNTFNFGKPYNALKQALDTFAANPTDTANLSGLTSAGLSLTQGLYDYNLVTRYPTGAGFGLDLGGAMPILPGLTGAVLLRNCPTIWPGRRDVYISAPAGITIPGKALVFQKDASKSSSENFTLTEPLGARVGLAWTGPLGLSANADAGWAFDGPGGSLGTPSLHLGVQESILRFLYLRGGVQLGGQATQIGAGAGLNLGIARLDLGAGADPSLRTVSAGLSANVGF